MDPALFTTKTQYRYRDIETATSYNSTLAGYTLKSSAWEQSGTGTVQYVQNWSSGFYTGSSLYSQYNKKSSKVSAYENETTKRVINSDAITGYLYFHWCAPGSFYSYEYSTGSYTTFHAYYSATSPWNYDCDYNDMSYNTKSTMCGNSTWYFVDEVYSQKYTDYKKLYTFERWGSYSGWSDTAVSASSTRQVETRTLYQLKDTGYGDHSYNAVVTAPSCTEKGYTTHTCALCGDSYIDSYTTATGHTFGNWVQTVAPGCDQPGTEVHTCNCGATESRDVTPAGHSYSAVVAAPTCSNQGYTTHTCTKCGNSYQDTFVPALGHSWLDASCTQAKVCTVCGATEGNALGHSYEADVTEPDCLNGGYTTYTCSGCGDSYVGDRVPALGHGYEAVVTAPTCTTAGYTTYTCAGCGHSYQDDHVSALGHSYQHTVTAPTCTSNGYTTHTCTACGKFYQDTVIPTWGHAWVAADCVTAKTCSVCGATEGEALSHSYEAVVTAPTCAAGGYTTYTCSKCGDSYVADETAALGHTMSEATCDEPATCSVCGATEGEALGHNHEAVVTAPDCVNGGYTTYTCSCGDSYVDDEVAALGHTMSEATCTAPATCSVCGATEGEALGHGYEAVVTAPTCAAGGYTTYTCSKCGDSYVADQTAALAHEAVTYSFVNNVHTFTCTTCGQVAFTKAEGKQFKINSAAPVLGEDIALNYRVTLPAGFENAYMVFEMNGSSTVISDGILNTTGATTGQTSFIFPGINPLTIGDNICATLYAYVDGYEVSLQIPEFSVLKYCDGQLQRTNDANLRTILSDVLVYGAKAQIYSGYKTDALVTNRVSAGVKLTPSTFQALDSSYNLLKVTGDKNADIDYKNAALVLGSKVKVKYGINCTNLEADYVFKINVGGEEFTYTTDDLVADENGNLFLEFDKLRAIMLGEKITATIWDGDTQVGRTVEYSVYTYVQMNQNSSNTALRELLQSIYNYGESAKKA